MSYDIDSRKDNKVYHQETITVSNAGKVTIISQDKQTEQFTKLTRTIKLLQGYDISAHDKDIGFIDSRVQIYYGGPEEKVDPEDYVFIDFLATNFWKGYSI